MGIWIDAVGAVIEDHQDYTPPDGGYFPSNFPKDAIPGLVQVIETPRPNTDAEAYTVDGQPRGGVTVVGHPGWTVEWLAGVPTQVWNTEASPALTDDEAAAIAKRNMALAAQEALNKSDVTVLRCAEKAIPVPAAWVTYRDDLRAIVKGGPGPIPERPAWPAGT